MDAKLRGTVCGIAAAVFYGTNPLGAMNLYADGISTNSTLFYRFLQGFRDMGLADDIFKILRPPFAV